MKNVIMAGSLARCLARGLSRGIIAVSMLAAPFMADAAEPRMEFMLTDGSVKSILSQDLEMVFTDSSLIASNGKESLEIPLSDLGKFYFSDAVTGAASLTSEAPVYTATDLGGVCHGVFESINAVRNTLPSGVYVITTGNETFKINVK